MNPDAPPSPPPRAARASPARALWQLMQPVLGVALLLAAVLGALGGTAVWLLRSEAGTQWLLPRLPGVQVTGARGALLSDSFSAELVELRWGGGQKSLRLLALRGSGLQWHWQPAPGQWVGLQAAELAAARVVLVSGPASKDPPALPVTLRLPLHLAVQSLRIDELAIDALPPLRDIRGRVELGADGGAVHRLEALALRWDRIALQADARVRSDAPFDLDSSARLRPADAAVADEWSAEARVQGPLQRLEAQATLQGKALPERPAPALELSATLTPVAPWPLARLAARTQALDLSSLSSAAPRTRLSGSVDIASSSLEAPIGAHLKLDNALAGRWSEGLLPLRQLDATLSARNGERDRLEIQRFDLQLGPAAQPAGRWQGSGEWKAGSLKLRTQIDALRPQFVDLRAAAMTVSGPLEATLLGLPSPDGTVPTGARPPLALDLRTTLEGRLDAAPQPVQLTLEGSASAQRLEVRELRARAGAALAAFNGNAQRTPAGDWQLKSDGSLTDFDPLPWWPGPEASAWRQGPHRLSGSWSVDLRLPARAAGMEWLVLAQKLAGTGNLRISESMLAGVPLQLNLMLGHRTAAGQAPSSLQGELRLADNRLTIDGRGDPLGPGDGDRLRLELQAGALAALAPLTRLLPELAAWTPRDGRLDASVQLDGRWPSMRSEGQASTQGLRLGELSVQSTQLSWRVDTGNDQPLNLHAEGRALALGRQRLDQFSADLRGTLGQHQLQLQAAVPLSPPPALEQWLGLRTRAGTLARLQGEGAWLADSAGGGRWRGRVAQFGVGPWDGSTLAADGGSAWAEARDLQAELQFDPQGGLATLQAAPGQLRLADNVRLRWDEVRLDLRGPAPRLQLRADIDPFLLAPLLARAQPGLGWGGDLRLAARVEIRAEDKLDADVVFERRDGDLKLTDDNGTQTFGLSDLRLALAAHDGNWYVTSALAGKSVGELAGVLNLRPPASQRWPTADTPIDGVIEARVANIGIWGAWVPPGWRLSGSLQTSASVSGRVGAPEYVGRVLGNELGVRNLLQGVDVRQGEVAVTLKGSKAQIDRFSLRGGDGTLAITGSAELGANPGAQLELKAERFRVLGRVDRQLSGSGSASLALGPDLLKLNGRFSVDDGLFDLTRSDAPSLDDDITVKRQAAAPSPAASEPAPRPRRSTQVSVDVDLGEKLVVRGRGLDTTLGGNLHVGSSAGRLTVNGIVRANGGTYAAYGQKLEIERGMLFFAGPPDSPTLDVLALRPNIDGRIGVAISGNLQSPRVRLYAGTDMSETEKLSWLVLGRAPDGLGRTDTMVLQRAAVALLAGEGEAPTDTLLRSLGIDELSVRQSDGEVRETVITLGKQISRRWYIGYERGVNATTGTWQLIYRIAQRFTLRAQSGQENSLDVIWVWRVGEPDQARVPKSAPATPP